jgi:hypothetical protein
MKLEANPKTQANRAQLKERIRLRLSIDAVEKSKADMSVEELKSHMEHPSPGLPTVKKHFFEAYQLAHKIFYCSNNTISFVNGMCSTNYIAKRRR